MGKQSQMFDGIITLFQQFKFEMQLAFSLNLTLYNLIFCTLQYINF